MKVSELIKELKKLPKNAEVYTCKDWEELDEENQLVDLYRLEEVCEQTRYLDMGLDWVTETDVILSFANRRASAMDFR